MKSVLLAALTLLVSVVAECEAQSRLRVVVEYVTASQVYLSAGQLQGLFPNDTVQAHRNASALDTVVLVIASSSRTRAVAVPVVASTVIARGEVLLITLSPSALQRAEALRAPGVIADADAPPLAPVTTRTPEQGVRSSGRIGLEFDAARTWSRFGTGESQVSERTYLTPAIRVRLRTENLPGGMRFTTNVRATQLSSSNSEASELRVQLYQASLEGDIKPAGMHYQLGRFYNPYESHSGYWDGMLLRVGSSRMGAGIVAGYTPAHGNQTVTSVSPKFSAFVDAHARNGRFRYDVDVSAHQQSNVFVASDHQFVGVSQSIGYGRAYFTQRAQFGKTAGQLELWQAQFTGSAVVAGPLSLNARFTTERNDLYLGGTAPDLGRRTRWSAGAVLSGKAGFANLEAGSVDSGLGSKATIGSANFFLPRALLIAGIGFSGNVTRDDAFTSTFFAPYLERYSGRMRARLGASYFRTDYGTTVFEQKGGDATLTFPVGKRSEIAWTATATSGSNLRTARTGISFWQSF